MFTLVTLGRRHSKKEYQRGYDEAMEQADKEKKRSYNEGFEDGYLTGRKDERAGRKMPNFDHKTKAGA